MSGSRDWRGKGYEYIPFIPNKKETRIPVPQRPMVIDQEAAKRRPECIRFYGMARAARDGDIEIVLPTQEEFDRVVYSCEDADNGNGEEDPAERSFMEGIAWKVLGEEEIKIGDGEKVGPRDSEKKDSMPKNDKEEDGDVVKGEIMKSAAEIREADKKGSACPEKVDAVLDVKEGDGRSLSVEHGAGYPIGVEGHAGRSSAEGGEARLATGDTECSKNGRDREEDSEMPMDDEEGNAEDSDEVKTVVDVEKPSSVVVACKNGDEGIVEGATSGPGGEKEPVGAEIEAKAQVLEAEQEVPAPEAEGQAVAAATVGAEFEVEAQVPEAEQEVPAPEAEGQAVAAATVGVEIEAEAQVPEAEQEVPAPEAEGQAVAAAIDGQNGNNGIPQGQEEFRITVITDENSNMAAGPNLRTEGVEMTVRHRTGGRGENRNAGSVSERRQDEETENEEKEARPAERETGPHCNLAKTFVGLAIYLLMTWSFVRTTKDYKNKGKKVTTWLYFTFATLSSIGYGNSESAFTSGQLAVLGILQMVGIGLVVPPLYTLTEKTIRCVQKKSGISTGWTVISVLAVVVVLILLGMGVIIAIERDRITPSYAFYLSVGFVTGIGSIGIPSFGGRWFAIGWGMPVRVVFTTCMCFVCKVWINWKGKID